MAHINSTDNEIDVSRCYVPASTIRKFKRGLARTVSLIVECGRSLVSIATAVGRAFEMAYIDPYTPPQNRGD